jgi:hypothetical protein
MYMPLAIKSRVESSLAARECAFVSEQHLRKKILSIIPQRFGSSLFVDCSNLLALTPKHIRQSRGCAQLYPALRVSSLRDVVGPYRQAVDLSRYEGLRQAGLPE